MHLSTSFLHTPRNELLKGFSLRVEPRRRYAALESKEDVTAVNGWEAKNIHLLATAEQEMLRMDWPLSLHTKIETREFKFQTKA